VGFCLSGWDGGAGVGGGGVGVSGGGAGVSAAAATSGNGSGISGGAATQTKAAGAGRPVRGKTGYSLPRASPRASVMQAVAGSEIQIAYGRPAVKQRKIWGELVPNGRVWRAGANEATQFTFNRSVQIEGHALPAGTYTFFVVPGEAEWTLIFNRVPRQWGAFNYNPAFDALRLTAKPAEALHEEYLRYDVDSEGGNAALVALSWEKRRIAFRIQARQ
jgi:Protein of unknown function (DUF2911)